MVKETQNSPVEILGTMPDSTGQNSEGYGNGVSNTSARRETVCHQAVSLMEFVVERENMKKAYYRVVRNKGCPGIDNMPVTDLKAYLKRYWAQIKEDLLSGRYTPRPVLRVEIPKPGGKGIRKLGIPTVVDRLIQQALHQILVPLFDPYFSVSSYGYRYGRNAHQAIRQTRTFVRSGRRWVVDMDLEKFFDKVNHDVLMSRVARRVNDKRVLGLIRRYLTSGVMADGLVTASREGTPQGGPLSPLLSNILLDDLDKELERRGHSFCRYADDCNIYVQSRRAGERVLQSISHFLKRRLRLTVNADKSAVDRPWKRTFLGYSMTWHKEPRLKVARQSIVKLKKKLKILFRKGRGRNIGKFINELRPVLTGWTQYFHLSDVKGIFEELDSWIRRRLRLIIWRQWKRPRTRYKNLMKHGFTQAHAKACTGNGRGPWWNSGASHMNRVFPCKFFDLLGLVSLSYLRCNLNLHLSGTAEYGSVCSVV